MTFEKWVSEYPMLYPCMYCFYWRDLGHGSLVVPSYWQRHCKRISIIQYDRIIPACHYSIYNNEIRGDPPIDGKCKHFIPIKNYTYLKGVIKE